MSSVGKLAAERHQKILLDLVTLPGNDTCADCKARAPRWASHNLGIFICVNCAAIHRKIGTHVTKVKSVNLDSWTKEQVEVMKSLGNQRANGHWNPDESKNPPPTNMEQSERDSELEKYIRAKYEHKRFIDRSPRVSDSPAQRLLETRSKSTPLPYESSKISSSTASAVPVKQDDSLFGSTLQYRPSSSTPITNASTVTLAPSPTPTPLAPAPFPVHTAAPNPAFLPPAFTPSMPYHSAVATPSLNHLHQAPQMSGPVWAEMVSLQSSSSPTPIHSTQSLTTAPQIPASQYGLLPTMAPHSGAVHYGVSSAPSFAANAAHTTMNPNLTMGHPGTSHSQGLPTGGWYANQVPQAGPYSNQFQSNVVEVPMTVTPGGFSQSQQFLQQYDYPQQYSHPFVPQQSVVTQPGFVNVGLHPSYVAPQQQPQYQQTYKWTD